MSSTELHTGTLTPVKTINSHQEFMDFVHENELTGHLTSSIEIYLDDDDITDVTAINGYAPLFLCAYQYRCGLPQYCFYKNVIYTFDNYIMTDDIVDDKYEINNFIRRADSSICFVSLFSNSETSFSVELRDGLDALLNKENKYECR